MDVVYVTSVINTGNNPWNYTHTRSVFTPEDRYTQTLQSILSVRQKLPNAIIILVECSDIPIEWTNTLQERVDYFIQLYDKEDIRKVCLESDKKGYGELLQTQAVLDLIREKNIVFRRLFKLSGRYWLNDSFQESLFSDTEFCFREPFPNSSCHPTVLYSVPYALFSAFDLVLKDVKYEFEVGSIMYEYALAPKCTPLKPIISCGVSGYVAVDGTLYEDNIKN
jgi:hypothetical protein